MQSTPVTYAPSKSKGEEAVQEKRREREVRLDNQIKKHLLYPSFVPSLPSHGHEYEQTPGDSEGQ